VMMLSTLIFFTSAVDSFLFDGYAAFKNLDVTKTQAFQPDFCDTVQAWGTVLGSADNYFRSISKHMCERTPTCTTGDWCHLYQYAQNSSMTSYISLRKTGLQGKVWESENGTCLSTNVKWLSLPYYGNPNYYVGAQYQVKNIYNIPSSLCEQECSMSEACGGFQIVGSYCLTLQLVEDPTPDGRTTFLKLPTA